MPLFKVNSSGPNTAHTTAPNPPEKHFSYGKRGRRIIFHAGCIITLFFILIFSHPPQFITLLDQRFYDTFHQVLVDKGRAQPVIVTIDELSLETFGQWPWPRDLLSTLFLAVLKGKPRSVGVDILLSEPDRTSLISAMEKLQSKGLIPPSTLSDDQKKALDNDQVLANAMRSGPFVLACKLLTDKTLGAPPGLLPLKAAIVTQHPKTDVFHWFPDMQGILAPLPLFLKASWGYGFVNSIVDNDGILRRTPFISGYKGQFYPSLALAALMVAMDTDRVILKTGPAGLVSVSIKNLIIPVSPQGNMLLHYRQHSSDFTLLSARDLLNGTIDPSVMNGKIVFIGASASGLGENHATPVEPYFFGVGVHATAVDNALNGNLLSRPFWASGVECMLVLVSGLICTLMLMYFRPWSCALSLVGATAFFWFSELYCLRNLQLFISMTYPFLTLFCTFCLLSVVRFRLEEKRLLKRTRDMAAAQNLTLLGITSLAATRDKETGLHVQRTALFVRIIAEEMSTMPRHKAILDDHTIELMYKSAPMHDIGKVGVPDSVLKKPGKLTESEFNEIKKHTEHGWRAIEEAEKISGTHRSASFLKISKEIILCHHEKWDGTGYNQGLKGEQIPLSARIMALADVYDALTAKRVYKEAFDHAKAREIIINGRGKHFDPDVVDAFLVVQDQFKEIAIKMEDQEAQ